jgi:hypothetical protein
MFVEWVGEGRKLTQTGRITLGDARKLVPALGTQDVIDPVIGGTVYRTASSQDLLHLTLIVEWAKSARLVRKTGNRLVPVKKNAALLKDTQKLWFALFTVFDQLGEAFLPSGYGESPLRLEFASGVRAILTSLYRANGTVATEGLCATAWATVIAPYDVADVPEDRLKHWRALTDGDTRRTLEALKLLGAVTVENETVELTELGESGTRRFLGEPEPGEPVYQVKITLEGVTNPPVWRRVLVPAGIRLDQLHEVVQAAMGWQNAHLHAFIDGQTHYGRPDPELQYRDERATRLNELVKPGGSLEYTYDFGDSWDHEILIEEATVAKSDLRYPRCIAGEAACPPEDSGGRPGYARLVEILTDPAHAEHQDMLDWLGLDSSSQFDPARFDLDETSQRLAAAGQANHLARRSE